MANHVYFNIDLSLDAGQTALVEKLAESCKTENGEMKWLSYEVETLPIYPVPYDEKDWYSWGCEQMGAKWIQVDDWHEYGMDGHSAWSPPIPFLTNLIQYIYNEVGGQPSARMTYEDEFRNCIGVDHFETYHEDGEYYCAHSENYIDGGELNALLEENLQCDVSADDFEWWDEYKDTGLVPSECVDEMVYSFWETGDLRWVN